MMAGKDAAIVDDESDNDDECRNTSKRVKTKKKTPFFIDFDADPVGAESLAKSRAATTLSSASLQKVREEVRSLSSVLLPSRLGGW